MYLAQKLLRKIFFIIVSIIRDVMMSVYLMMCVVMGVNLFLGKGFTVIDRMVGSCSYKMFRFIGNCGSCFGKAKVMRFVILLGILAVQES